MMSNNSTLAKKKEKKTLKNQQYKTVNINVQWTQFYNL